MTFRLKKIGVKGCFICKMTLASLCGIIITASCFING